MLFPAKVKERNRLFRESHPNYKKKYTSTDIGRAKVNALQNKRVADKLQRTPKWLTKKQLKEIEEFYILAQELAWLNQDGKPFHVDHIIPLRGKKVSGLHVPWNLQLLSEKENNIKNNQFDFTNENESWRLDE